MAYVFKLGHPLNVYIRTCNSLLYCKRFGSLPSFLEEAFQLLTLFTLAVVSPGCLLESHAALSQPTHAEVSSQPNYVRVDCFELVLQVVLMYSQGSEPLQVQTCFPPPHTSPTSLTSSTTFPVSFPSSHAGFPTISHTLSSRPVIISCFWNVFVSDTYKACLLIFFRSLLKFIFCSKGFLSLPALSQTLSPPCCDTLHLPPLLYFDLYISDISSAYTHDPFSSPHFSTPQN